MKKSGLVINSVVNSEVAKKLNMGGNKKPIKRYTLLNLEVEVHDRAVIFNWAVKNIGFGQITYSVDKSGNIQRDDERMSEEFCSFVLKQALKQHKAGSLKSTSESTDTFLFTHFLTTLVNDSRKT